MDFTENILTSAQKAHKALERQFDIKKLRCKVFYYSRNGYLATRKTDEKIQSLLAIGGYIFTGMGGGLYILSNIHPKETDFIFCSIYFSYIAFYLYRKREITRECKKITLPERPIWIYLHEFSKFIDWRSLVKFFLLELCVLIFGTWGLLSVIEEKHYFFSVALLPILMFIGIVCIGITIVFFFKLRKN